MQEAVVSNHAAGLSSVPYPIRPSEVQAANWLSIQSTSPSGGSGEMDVCRMVSSSILNSVVSRSHCMEYSCHLETSTDIADASCRTVWPASFRRRREMGLKARKGKARNAGASSRDGTRGELSVPAKKPWAGISSRKDSQFGGEA